MNSAMIPTVLTDRRQWCLWKHARATKVPYQVNGRMAKSNDSTTWCSYASAAKRLKGGGFSGIGFVFDKGDPFVGIDLDGCRNPDTGVVADWAQEIIERLSTYCETSPSKSGVKLWLVGKNPFDRGRKVTVAGVSAVCDKPPAIELYDRGRYFAVTGWRISDRNIESNESGLLWLANTYMSN